MASVPLVLLGCASAIEAARATKRFKAIFDCPEAYAEGEFGGYRVEGCGRVAHFRCFETDDHDDDHKRIGEVVVESMIEGALVPDTCVLEYAETQKTPAPEPALRIVVDSTHDKNAVTSARMFVLGGYITALGRPAKHPDRVLLKLRSAATFEAEPCTTSLRRDGVSIAANETLRVNDNELLVLVRADVLRDADQAQRFGGSACGFSFELDDSARKKLSAFEVRFRRACKERRSSTSRRSSEAALLHRD